MNWYKKAQNRWVGKEIEDVANFLTKFNIVNEIDGRMVKVQRDSIVNAFKGKDENGAYEELIKTLDDLFGSTFSYVLKDDDWFWLEKYI